MAAAAGRARVFFMWALLSLCSIPISLVSLLWSIHTGRRDRAQLRAWCTYYGAGYIELQAVNVGRRPIVLTSLVTLYCGGSWSAHSLGTDGVRLDEGEQFSEVLKPGDNYTVSNDDGEATVDLRFEDSAQRRYRIKHAKKCLEQL